MPKLPILAALAAALPGAPAIAQSVSAPRTAVVAHADLDLRTEGGVRTLDRRIWRAVVAVCGVAPDYDLAGKNDVRECRRETRVAASADAQRAIADARHAGSIRVTDRRK